MRDGTPGRPVRAGPDGGRRVRHRQPRRPHHRRRRGLDGRAPGPARAQHPAGGGARDPRLAGHPGRRLDQRGRRPGQALLPDRGPGPGQRHPRPDRGRAERRCPGDRRRDEGRGASRPPPRAWRRSPAASATTTCPPTSCARWPTRPSRWARRSPSGCRARCARPGGPRGLAVGAGLTTSSTRGCRWRCCRRATRRRPATRELQGVGSGDDRPPMDELAERAWLTQGAAAARRAARDAGPVGLRRPPRAVAGQPADGLHRERRAPAEGARHLRALRRRARARRHHAAAGRPAASWWGSPPSPER